MIDILLTFLQVILIVLLIVLGGMVISLYRFMRKMSEEERIIRKSV